MAVAVPGQAEGIKLGWQRVSQERRSFYAAMSGGKSRAVPQTYVPVQAWSGRAIRDRKDRPSESEGGREKIRRTKRAACFIEDTMRGVDGRDYVDDRRTSKVVFSMESRQHARAAPSTAGAARQSKPFRDTMLNLSSKSLWTAKPEAIGESEGKEALR